MFTIDCTDLIDSVALYVDNNDADQKRNKGGGGRQLRIEMRHSELCVVFLFAGSALLHPYRSLDSGVS